MILQARTMENDETKVGWVDLRNENGKYVGTMPIITFCLLFGMPPGYEETKKMDVRIVVNGFDPDRRNTVYYPRTLESVEVEHVRDTMNYCHGNRKNAAEILGIGERTLYRWLKDKDIQTG
jgi:transcriptional regulator of acetoin/glycerol metabolism